MLVLDVPLKVYLLPKLDVADGALEAANFSVNQLMTSQVAAGGGIVWTLVTGVRATSCQRGQTSKCKRHHLRN